jgi:membrane protease YdiL (CAAX protease family)
MSPHPQSNKGKISGKTSWGQVIGTLLLLLAIIGGASYGAFVVASPLGWLKHPETRLATFLLGAIVGELAALGVLTWWLRQRGGSLRALGLGRATNWRGMAMGLLAALLYSGLTAALNPTVGPNLLRLIPLKGLAVVAALVAGLVEETIFRGYLMTSLDEIGQRRVTQVVVSGVAFAVAQLLWVRQSGGSPGHLRGHVRAGYGAGDHLSRGKAQPDAGDRQSRPGGPGD